MTKEDTLLLQQLNEAWAILRSGEYVQVRQRIYEITGWTRHYCAYILTNGRKDEKISELYQLRQATKQALLDTPSIVAFQNNKILAIL